ncbi:UDP-glucose/GDP-mannose dehydrogenase family protein [Clostridium sp. P21]|uniref:UDP-glucose 6-dehydrogenase n=1 Tax=Clostridium muellerianum TaxID=2716538 RepID=A0A7Y0HQ32_9CLOT|nr:UDP-glucose/GDP-mannose dehydrogenase family protein [Clostridium muellerianum]NMM63691.1 UDP-glucose/GDP-mannose dehydrogenase family protein [Clostridium muellerianum]
MSRIAVVGSGYVGLVSGAILSDFGHQVMCVDVDQNKIDLLNDGIIPIFEPGLDRIVQSNIEYERLSFSTDIEMAIKESDVIFIAVGTPSKDDGSADLKYVLEVAKSIATYMNGYKIIVDKCTVPIGTGKKVKFIIQSILDERNVNYTFDVVSNPEFLREGSAVQDFTHPDRVVIGTESDKALNIMKEVYQVLYINETPFVETSIETAEMIKYASNAFLAMKIAYINEIANLCEKVGANVKQVAKAMGKDGRISPKFLHPGPGYGGSCFPKDTKALAEIAKEYGETISLIETTIAANERHKHKMVDKIINSMGSIEGKIISVLGITFKPNTDDVRDAPSLVILPELVKLGAKIKVFDPEGEKEGSKRFTDISDSLTFCKDEYEAISKSDAIVLMTEWNQFRNLDMDRIVSITEGRYFFDLRNIYNRNVMEEKGFCYYGVGI